MEISAAIDDAHISTRLLGGGYNAHIIICLWFHLASAWKQKLLRQSNEAQTSTVEAAEVVTRVDKV